MTSLQAQQLAQYRAMYIVLWRMMYISQFYYTYKVIRELHQAWESEQEEIEDSSEDALSITIQPDILFHYL